jgi:HAD superfamily hydrolase (TIGR01450 family)
MGSRIARRLLGAGHELVVWNRTSERGSSLIAAGAVFAESPADAARRAEMVITMVSGPEALGAVTAGAAGILAGAHAGLRLIDMSTVGPGTIRELATRLPPGVSLFDAPVLGSVKEAEAGSLTIFVGGPAVMFEEVRPTLATLGFPIHVGELGSGAAAKLVVNATLFDTLGSLGEALALAQGLGLSREVAWQLLATTPLAAQAEKRRPLLEAGDYPPRFSLSLARKDARLINQAGEAVGVDLRLTRAAETWLAEAERAGLGPRDYTTVLATILGRSPTPSPVLRPRPARSVTATSSLRDVEGLIVDLDGVIWRGERPIEGAADAIAAMRNRGVGVLFLTNEPRYSRAAFAARLSEIGIPAGPADVLTSAAATAKAVGALQGLTHRRVLVIGPDALHEEVRQQSLELVSIDEPRDAEVVVLGGHEGFNYGELRAATTAIRNGARLYATGRDAVFPTEDGPRPGTGAVLAAVETAGGAQAVVVGKPEPVMFEMAQKALGSCRRVAVVGDHLVADVAGAKRAGLAAILVLTGTTSREDVEHADIQPDLVIESIADLPRLTG